MIRAWLITITALAVLVAGCSWSRSRPRQSLPYYCTPVRWRLVRRLR